MQFILFFILCYTMASIIVEQKIFEEVRNWLVNCAETNNSFVLKKLCQLIRCTFCTGFWCGIFITISGFNIFNIGFFDFFYGGLAGAFCAYTGHLVFEWVWDRFDKIGIKNY